jgi:prephenate dehydratase
VKLAPHARIAFQGERGAFSEEAALKLAGPDATLVPRPTFEAAFSAIHDGVADFILAPIENSLAGSVHRSFDLLVESDLHIIGEEIIPIVHNLIAPPGARIEDLTVVESHPVALAQCETFFIEHPSLKRVAAEDTAGSVRDVMRRGDPTHAAIASKRAAHIYGGSILRAHLEDDPENYTRFLLLAPPTHPEGTPGAAGDPAADKLSLVFELAHLPGALYHSLAPFAQRNINMMKIESRPMRGKPWQYRFHLDLQASANDPEVRAAISELQKFSAQLRILGSYKAAGTAQHNSVSFTETSR